MSCYRRRPDWWRQVAYSGTKLLYQPEPEPVVYIIPVKNILGRLALVPYGAHGTIPYDWHPLQRSHYPLFTETLKRAFCTREVECAMINVLYNYSDGRYCIIEHTS